MINFTPDDIGKTLYELYEIFGNIVTIDDIPTRNIILICILTQIKIICAIIKNYKENRDANPSELKSLYTIKERLDDLSDKCKIMVENKNIKLTLKQIHKMSGHGIRNNNLTQPDLDINFILRFVNLITNFNFELALDEKEKLMMFYVKKSYLNLAYTMIEKRLLDKELSSGFSFCQKRDLMVKKDFVRKTSDFVDKILINQDLKIIGTNVYKIIK